MKEKAVEEALAKASSATNKRRLSGSSPSLKKLKQKKK